MMDTHCVSRIGWKAHAALARTAGAWTALPGFAGSGFRLAGDEPIFVGTGRVALHPRAVVLRARGARPGGPLVPWRSRPLALDAGALRAGAVALASSVQRIGTPRGFAAFLAGTDPGFPLDRARPHVHALATAIDRDDPQLARDCALPLLGLGPGLTPSGDDFAGAVLFARRLRGLDARWAETARSLIEIAPARTHAISAALFCDLIDGESFAALGRLAERLAAQRAVLPAARALTAIGHSSGWDMLAGLLLGAAGSAVLRDDAS